MAAIGRRHLRSQGALVTGLLLVCVLAGVEIDWLPSWAPAPHRPHGESRTSPGAGADAASCAQYGWLSVIGTDLRFAEAQLRPTTVSSISAYVRAQRLTTDAPPLFHIAVRAGRAFLGSPAPRNTGEYWWRVGPLLGTLLDLERDWLLTHDVDLLLCPKDDCLPSAAGAPVPVLAFAKPMALARAGEHPAAAARVAAEGDASLADARGAALLVRVPYTYSTLAPASRCTRGRLDAHTPLAAACAAPAAPRRAPVAVWRGTWANAQREALCAVAAAEPAHLDVGVSVQRTNASSCRLTPHEALEAQGARAAMLIDVGGGSWADRLPRGLATGSACVRVQRPLGWEDYLEHYLVPGVHYVPVDAGLRNLSAAVRSCVADEHACARIGAAGAAEVASRVRGHADACFFVGLLSAYSERVQRAFVADDCEARAADGASRARACSKLVPLAPGARLRGRSCTVLASTVVALPRLLPVRRLVVWLCVPSAARAVCAVCALCVLVLACTGFARPHWWAPGLRAAAPSRRFAV